MEEPMTNENPFEPSTTPATDDATPHEHMTGLDAYNVVSDTVTGVNFRKRDNLMQALFIFIAVVVVALVFTVLALLIPSWDMPWFIGTAIGAFAGLVLGALTSGFFLMIYRAVQHARGKHK